MKKSVLAMLMVIVLAGCSWFSQVTPGTVQEALLLTAAYDTGYYIAKNNPSYVPQIINQTNAIVTQINGGATVDIMKAALMDAIDQLSAQFSTDPIIAGNLKILLNAFVKPSTTVTINSTFINSLVTSFIDGVNKGAPLATKHLKFKQIKKGFFK